MVCDRGCGGELVRRIQAAFAPPPSTLSHHRGGIVGGVGKCNENPSKARMEEAEESKPATAEGWR